MTSIADTLQSAPTLQTLWKLVEAAQMVNTLSSAGAWTLFAPADEAFAKVPPNTLDALLSDTERLRLIVAHHIVEGKFNADELAKLDSVIALDEQTVQIEHTNGILVDQAKILQADINCDNGLIHVIDSPLLAIT